MFKWMNKLICKDDRNLNTHRKENREWVKNAVQEFFDDMEKKKNEQVTKEFADSLEVGDLSSNTNWMFIQEIGKFLSPKGDNNLHKIILTEKNHRGENIKIAEISCTNQIYSEWVVCLCETMWHTKNKVLEDVNGNKYPVGKMCGYVARIEF